MQLKVDWKTIVLVILFIFPNVFAQSEGFTVTSISTSSVITNKTNPKDVFWIINTQFNGGGQFITGTITQDTFKSFMGNKVYPKKALNITASAAYEQAIYEIQNEGVRIYKYELQTFEAPISCPLGICYTSADAPPCPQGATWDIPLGISFWGKVKNRYCITKKQVGVKGVYTNPTINFNAKIRLSNGESPIEKMTSSPP